MRPKKLGRPVGSGRGLTIPMWIRVDVMRAEKYRQAAERAGLTMSEWLRRAADHAAGK